MNLGYTIFDFGFRFWDLGFTKLELRFWILDLGFRIWIWILARLLALVLVRMSEPPCGGKNMSTVSFQGHFQVTPFTNLADFTWQRTSDLPPHQIEEKKVEGGSVSGWVKRGYFFHVFIFPRILYS